MKTVIRFLTASILVLTQLSIAQWVQTNGPKNSPEISFAAMGDSVLYCFDGRLKKITLGQDAWTIVPESYHFLGWMGPLAVCGSILLGYAENLSGQHFVYASTDGGGSWTSVLTDSTALLFYGGGRIPSLEIIGSTFFVSTPASFNNRPVRTPTAFRSNVELGGELFVSHDIGRT